MAAIDLSDLTDYPWHYTGTAGATWQEFILPPGCGKYTITNEHATQAIYHASDKAGVPGAGVETPADGGAVGTHRGKVAAGAVIEYQRRGVSEPLATSSLFIAASGAGTGYTLTLEPRP